MAGLANNEEITNKLKEFSAELDLDIMGIASVEHELFLQAPEEYQLKNILEGAKSIIVIGKFLLEMRNNTNCLEVCPFNKAPLKKK